MNFSGDDQPSAHLMFVIFLRAICFRAGTVGTVADRTGLCGFVKGYERDYNKFYRDAEVDRLAMGAAGVKRTQVSTRGTVVIPNYMDVLRFHTCSISGCDVMAAWQTTHFNFHDIDENVLKLDILGT